MFSRRALTTINNQYKATALRFYSEGSVGSTRSDGSSDAFTKREKAQEDLYIRKHQAEQIAKLKEELAKQKEQLDDLASKIKN